jgi:V/A-type H+-transporting ATPase subunit D
VANLKLTKTELRVQQVRLTQLRRYLPTLQLKKAMLQAEVGQAQLEIDALDVEYHTNEERVKAFSPLLSDKNAYELFYAVKVREVITTHENIAGVDIPYFKSLVFEEPSYGLFDTPAWFEAAIEGIKELIEVREKTKVVREKKRALEKELREVSIRVNLFEKIMIPRAMQNLKKIKIFLGDVQLAAVCAAKVSKKKINERAEKL